MALCNWLRRLGTSNKVQPLINPIGEPWNPNDVSAVSLGGDWNMTKNDAGWETHISLKKNRSIFTQMLHVWIIYLHQVKNGYIQGEM